MNFTEDSYKLLHDVQKKCNELNQKIDSHHLYAVLQYDARYAGYF